VIARIGNTVISEAALERRVAIEARSAGKTAPVPPSYSTCVAELAKISRALSRATLKARCSNEYKTLVQQALNGMIAGVWAIGEAAEQNVAPSERAVRMHLEKAIASRFGSHAKFEGFLSETDENVSDLLFMVKQSMAVEALFKVAASTLPAVTPATIASYYREHRRSYLVPEQRDIAIIHTYHKAIASRILDDLHSGTSFATIARRLRAEQQIYSAHAGLVSGLKPHIFSEKALDAAIFSAKPHVITGPVRLDLKPTAPSDTPAELKKLDGYYVFEVHHISPEHQEPLNAVKDSIAKQLPAILRQRTLAVFIARWRAHWKALTDCRPDVVIKKCRQFHARRGEPREDQSTFT
jgi:hypothetical protein